jgi:uncharacterized protein YajQ (UPF0234 family)
MPFIDVVFEVDAHELSHAIDQAVREVSVCFEIVFLNQHKWV